MTSRSSQACWTFLPIGVVEMASMVVIEWPMAALTGITHARLGLPSRCTVQAPHKATPQPNFVPFMPSRSRKTHKRGMSGSAPTLCDLPLIFSVSISVPPKAHSSSGPSREIPVADSSCSQPHERPDEHLSSVNDVLRLHN